MQLVGEAKRNNVGVAAFNVIHIETAEALVAASERAQLPLILQLSHNVCDTTGASTRSVTLCLI